MSSGSRYLLAHVVLLAACASPDDELVGATEREALTRQAPIAIGDTTCAKGGVRIEDGVDTDGDRVLEPHEVTGSRVVCARAAGAPRVVFVSSASYRGDEVGSRADADAKCQELADGVDALLGKRFRAFLGGGTGAPPPDGFTTDGAFVRVDGTVVADDLRAMLRDGTHFWADDEDVLLAPISYTERGDEVDDVVRTGADDARATYDCHESVNDRLTDAVTQRAMWRAGRTSRLDNAWLDATQVPCARPARLYCFEQ